jgi:hypothetical protein
MDWYWNFLKNRYPKLKRFKVDVLYFKIGKSSEIISKEQKFSTNRFIRNFVQPTHIRVLTCVI